MACIRLKNRIDSDPIAGRNRITGSFSARMKGKDGVHLAGSGMAEFHLECRRL